jgi:hypothetical protein
VAPCTGARLSGSFSAIYGSAGAGNISYALRLRNSSARTCFVSGLAGLRLLGKDRKPLPTNVRPAFRAGLTAVRVVLRPGAHARATARFSPDVPGPGDGRPHSLRAERLQGAGHAAAGRRHRRRADRAADPACEHALMFLSALSRA